MQINITTFAARRVQYIDAMLESLFSSDWRGTDIPINLIVGSEDESHVAQYSKLPFVRIVPWDIESHATLRSNCTLNKIRALRFGDDEETLICEDDIVFPITWLSSLRRATAELKDELYVLSLFAARPALGRTDLLAGKTLIKPYPMASLQGAQALFYPMKVLRLGVARFLAEHIKQGCGDHLIGKYARANAALYATEDILVDHIGSVSCFHK